MPDPRTDANLGSESFEGLEEDSLDNYYSVWDLGPFPDPSPEVAARFDALARELIALSERTARLRLEEMFHELEGPEDRDEATRVEMGNHQQRIDRLKTVIYQMRTGVDF